MTDYVRYYDEDAVGLNDGTSEENAWTSEGTMASALNTLMNTTAVNGDSIIVYCKRSETARTSTALWTSIDSTITDTASSKIVPLVFEGYKSIPGDGGDDGINNYFQRTKEVQFSRCTVRYFDIRIGQTSSGRCFMGNNDALFESCYAVAEATGTSNTAHGYQLTYSGCHNCYGEISSGTTSTGDSHAFIGSTHSHASNCFFRGPVKIQTRFSSGPLTNVVITRSDSSSNNTTFASRGLLTIDGDVDPRGWSLNNVTIYNSPGAGIWFEDSYQNNGALTSALVMQGLVIYNCAGAAFDNNPGAWTSTIPLNTYNSFYGLCTGGKLGTGVSDPFSRISLLSSDPFVDAANDDFRINENSTGGAEIASASTFGWTRWGLPFTFDLLSGAIQRAAGSSIISHAY